MACADVRSWVTNGRGAEVPRRLHFDPTATLVVHRGNGFDAGFRPYQSARLSRYFGGRGVHPRSLPLRTAVPPASVPATNGTKHAPLSHSPAPPPTGWPQAAPLPRRSGVFPPR